MTVVCLDVESKLGALRRKRPLQAQVACFANKTKTDGVHGPWWGCIAHRCLLLAEPGMEPRNMVCRFLLQHHSGAHRGKFESDSVT